ncbi:predicted protein [Naegleria gruberi]|uniref:Predicted protein n=1 Tax=Naegleria gruberi TaxID=5762 RepID=D2V1B2_NAEGR|nr:uncharacterized protein NAEGRDRAFT_62824 [Naegleria gruberi]EFC49439.1 predicted protein [Naegleria gruberi]|eukprot:XP_002682183.1 predicted protein [Naegleria gruberi strain NEG-M]
MATTNGRVSSTTSGGAGLRVRNQPNQQTLENDQEAINIHQMNALRDAGIVQTNANGQTQPMEDVNLEYLIFKTVYWIEKGDVLKIESIFNFLSKQQQHQHEGPSSKSKILPLSELVNTYDKCFNRTPLYSACAKGMLPLVKVLVQQGSRLDEVNGPSKQTSVWIAANFGFFSVVKYLLKKGCDKNKSCSLEKSPELIAKDRGFYELAEYIKNFDYPLYQLVKGRKVLFKKNLSQMSEKKQLCDINIKCHNVGLDDY